MAAEQSRPKVARFRARWKAHQHRLDPKRLIFIDETWIKTNMTRTCGWAAKGKRLTAHVPHGHWKTTTFVGALRLSGMTAPMVIDGPMNGAWFLACVQQVLAPTLKPGDVVIMDNLAAHKSTPIRDAIENAFAKLKALLRKAAARSIDQLRDAIARIIETYSPLACANDFAAQPTMQTDRKML